MFEEERTSLELLDEKKRLLEEIDALNYSVRNIDRELDRRAAAELRALSSPPPETPAQRIMREGRTHRSDCAIYNEPASPAGPCDCGAAKRGAK